jgi:hypothetical protein
MILLGLSNYLTRTLQRRFDSADPVNRRDLVHDNQVWRGRLLNHWKNRAVQEGMRSLRVCVFDVLIHREVINLRGIIVIVS